jgi:hypothetical protein
MIGTMKLPKVLNLLLVAGCSGLLSPLRAAELERINFFPRSDSFLEAGYAYQNNQIEAAASSESTQQLRDYINRWQLGLGHRVLPATFLGVNFSYENTVESGLRYGLPTIQKFRSHGVTEPQFFSLIRLREQQAGRGLIDLALNFSPKLSTRRVATNNANRFNGRHLAGLRLSHGYLEEGWEFRTSLSMQHSFRGEERDVANAATMELAPASNYSFMFEAQRDLINQWFLHGGIGFIYRGTQEISSPSGNRREVQAGTASSMQVGLKRNLTATQLLRLDYQIQRGDYFIKSNPVNFDGRWSFESLNLSYVLGF